MRAQPCKAVLALGAELLWRNLGGNTCSSNGNNFGVLQLTSKNLPTGMSSSQYMALPLQQQVDIWIQQAGPSSQGKAFNTVNGDVGSSVNGYPITSGTAAACAQFGALICSKDLASLNATGQCPSQGNGGVRATNATLANGTANLDGNGQSICSWGQVIQKKIDASGCSNGNQASPNSADKLPLADPRHRRLDGRGSNLRRLSGVRRLAAPKHRQPARRRQHRRCCFRRPNIALVALARGE